MHGKHFALSFCIQKSVCSCTWDNKLLRSIPLLEIDANSVLYGSFIFNICRILHTGWTNIQSYPQSPGNPSTVPSESISNWFWVWGSGLGWWSTDQWATSPTVMFLEALGSHKFPLCLCLWFFFLKTYITLKTFLSCFSKGVLGMK